MDEEKKWLLMTYYCPTHGDLAIVKPIRKKEISETFLKKRGLLKLTIQNKLKALRKDKNLDTRVF